MASPQQKAENQCAASAPPLRPWRSLEDSSAAAAAREWLEREFPNGASEWGNEFSRRKFLELMGASMALAGLSACTKAPEKIMPYVRQPESIIPGKPLYYATAMPIDGYGRGILVESHMGRPTKIEGNPEHPASLGATDAVTQAAILGLYDPDRSRHPVHRGNKAGWEDFQKDLGAQLEAVESKQGEGLHILSEPTTSPTFLRLMQQVSARLPKAVWYQYLPLPDFPESPSRWDYDFEQADIVFSIGSDFLFDHPQSLRWTREFISRRRSLDASIFNRLYVAEPFPTLTGAMADLRLPERPDRFPALLRGLATMIGMELPQGAASATLTEAERQFLEPLSRALIEKQGRSIVLAGPAESLTVHALARRINRHLGNNGKTVRALPALRSDSLAALRSIGELTDALNAGKVRTLFVLGGNPVYNAPADLQFAEALGKAPFSAHLSLYRDETSMRCAWHLPETHFLETWGDIRSFDGTATLMQPLIVPLYDGKSPIEVLALLAGKASATPYELVRETWKNRWNEESFETAWKQSLHDGLVKGTTVKFSEEQNWLSAEKPPSATPEPPEDELVLIFKPDPTIGDGRWSNNAWLQELPKPITKLVWDNAAFISPAAAAAQSLENGDMVELKAGGRNLEAPVWIQPGQADGCVLLHLGYGRSAAGKVGNGHGVNASRLQTFQNLWRVSGLTLTKTGGKHQLVTTQDHHSMEGRDLVRVRLLGTSRSEKAHEKEKDRKSLHPDYPKGDYAWGMAIDLSACIGCNACVTACQAENNIPVVGKEQVARGREMHWLRVDRYYEGPPEDPRVHHQPVPCMHCEKAPCEVVCPVAATVHSHEGLNDMVYNRCVGTRYCSNNCPYKVRRFNFLDYRGDAASPVTLQRNPDVTVRGRGVMEKCTYCVQRINAARIEAKIANRLIRDGEIQTACQQACPARAIVFGNIQDGDSEVSRWKEDERNYALLEELNTRPRTTYLESVKNPGHGQRA